MLVLVVLFVGRNENAADFWTPLVNGNTLSFLALMIAVGTSMVGSLFSAETWNNIGFAAAEVKEPHRTVPRAMMFGTILAGARVYYAMAQNGLFFKRAGALIMIDLLIYKPAYTWPGLGLVLTDCRCIFSGTAKRPS